MGLAKSGKLLPGSDESLLGEVFALAEISQAAVDERANEGLIPGDDQAESGSVLSQAFSDEVGVAGIYRCGWVQIEHCHFVSIETDG